MEVPLQANDLPIEHLDFKEAEAGDVDITASEFLLSIGRGIEDRDNISQFEELAEKMGATLAVSRPLVDSGWIPNSRQVGQSGKTVKPRSIWRWESPARSSTRPESRAQRRSSQ